jgi:hypothetical protein
VTKPTRMFWVIGEEVSSDSDSERLTRRVR